MIRLTYRTDDGDIEANFDTVEEMYKFQEDIRKKKEAEKAAYEAEESKRIEEFTAASNGIKDSLKDIFFKAKNIGLAPRDLVRMIEETLKDLVEED